jgi:hypothetical protein
MKLRPLALALLVTWLHAPTSPAQTETELKNLKVDGGIQDGKARLVIEALLNQTASRDKLIFATTVQHLVKPAKDKITHQLALTFDILQGKAEEMPLTIAGEGEIKQVTGEALQDWSIRQEANGIKTLILRPKKSEPPVAQVSVTVIAERPLQTWKNPLPLFTLTPPQPALFNGFVKVEPSPELELRAEGPTGLFPVEAAYLPAPLKSEPKPDEAEPLTFQFHGSAYTLPLAITVGDPETRQVVLRDFKLTGQLREQAAAFTLTATARVTNPKGGILTLLAGNLALTELPQHPDWRVTSDRGRYVLFFKKSGDFPLSFKFHAAVSSNGGWNAVNFRVASSALQPIVLQGLPVDTQFEFTGAARPERMGNDFVSYLPPDGTVKLSWRAAPPETEGKLFYSAEMLSQISIAPGLMRQVALLDGKVMQGELDRVTLTLRGSGEVTRVLGDQVLAWKVEPGANAAERKLVVQFNQPQKGQFALHVQLQSPIGAFPQTIDAMQLRPEGATRFAGYFRIINEGAVRLEVVQAKGLSQVSPEQFPESDRTKSVFRAPDAQRFAYRFSGADFELRIQADQILPEVTVSQLIAYHHGENELSIDCEIEADVREAPLREMLLRVPKGYVVAKLNAANLSDYFLRDADDGTDAELRIVYGQPVSGRQVVQLRLERNQALGAPEWPLPRIEVMKAKSVRGHIAVSSDAGFRLAVARTQGLAEIATAFFPRKVAGIQAAFRLNEPTWQATVRVERLPQSIQADVVHLFSIGEGIAYGSSVLNYVISGAPISLLKVELSAEYFNVEFTGKDIRSWQKTETGYVVQLHTPVSGAYPLLATYERPFKAQGETLAFTGARPLDAQSEQGHTIVISAYQFQVQAAEVSAGLVPLETGEVPSEYRLLFNAPVLAAYRYSARPFSLKLALSPLIQGDSLSQVVDRATLSTRISKEGQVLTNAQYFVKSRGNSNFRVNLPEGTQLWSATVNGAPVVPVTDSGTNLVPLPPQADSNSVLNIELKLATRSKNPSRVNLAMPVVAAPVMLAEWKLSPDTSQRLAFRKGSLTPVGGQADVSGFAGISRAFRGHAASSNIVMVLAALALVALAIAAWRWAAAPGVTKYSGRFMTGLNVGILAFLLAGFPLLALCDAVKKQSAHLPGSITFVAPVQQSGQAMTAEVSNVGDEFAVIDWIAYAWPALFAPFFWGYGWLANKPSASILGWTLLAWATLRIPNGGSAFLVVIAIFIALQVAWPALRQLWKQPRRSEAVAPPPPPANGGSTAPVVASLMAGLLITFGSSAAAQAPAQPEPPPVPKENPIAESVTQQIRVEEKFAFVTAKVRWNATKGQRLPVIFDPAVLTNISYPTGGLKLVQSVVNQRRAQQLLALESGAYDIEFKYQVPVTKKDAESGVILPVQFGLVNQLTATLVNLDVDVVSPQAVSIDRKTAGKDTVATVVLSAANDVWLGWRPRSRDVAKEKAIFYAELTQLYIPTAGVIEGVHHASIRPAQGELNELFFTVPKGTTITDVFDPASMVTPKENQKAPVPIVSQWRFDPDAGKLRVNLNPPQSRPFGLLIRSQIATGTLPVTQTAGLLSVDNAAGQIGLLGIATGNEVQLDSVDAATLSPINLEDFPANVATVLHAQIPGLTLRRAFRYADPKVTAALKASAVEPDVRVESQDTLSLGEDRVVLAVNAAVAITRAGIFRLSFELPAGMDVESITGEALSHWTELKTETARVITLHLKGRTEGQQQFTINLTGAGLKAVKAWAAPHLTFREATKQRGTFLIVPEQGMRLQVGAREGITQLDPQKSGIKQKGVLAFRVLQTPWSLALDVEQVDPWVQVTSLQHAAVDEAQVKVVTNLQYQIENTGLKSMRVSLPVNAESVRFQGEQVADFLQVPNTANEGMQQWEVKLHRRMLGQYLLQVSYQTPLAADAAETGIRGVQAVDVNLQRGFVTVQSGGRLQLRVDAPPPALQPTEWQSIPKSLQQDLAASSASFAFRLVEPAFQLPLKIQRHNAAKLLPARVNNITFTSVISDNGAMLTHTRLELMPGDKRLLQLTLPKDARFWFAFVNQNGVWPWRDQDRILIPLEQQSREGKSLPVEFFFSSQAGKSGSNALDLQLLAPKFDLPLENITWHVHLGEKWSVKKWTGSLQLQSDQIVSRAAAVDVQTYLQREAGQLREKTKAAEEMLVLGNTALAQGNPQEARRAFESAYGLSQHDIAFNEDARVQLHNLKIQQAVVGLNVRQSVATGNTDAFSGKLAADKNANYTQQDAKQIIDRNTADDNAAFNRLAERIIQQQDAAVTSPSVIRANIPEQGRRLTFGRAVAVDTWADLNVGLKARTATTASWGTRFLILLGTFGALGALRFFATTKKSEPFGIV